MRGKWDREKHEGGGGRRRGRKCMGGKGRGGKDHISRGERKNLKVERPSYRIKVITNFILHIMTY